MTVMKKQYHMRGDFIMYQVTKRDGQVVDFEISKISDAITKAFVAIDKQYFMLLQTSSLRSGTV